jgi:Helix-turn-helix domain
VVPPDRVGRGRALVTDEIPLLQEQRPDIGEKELRVEEVEPVDVPDPLLGIDEVDAQAMRQGIPGLGTGRAGHDLTVAGEDRRQGPVGGRGQAVPFARPRHWRMQIAAGRLAMGNAKVAAIAEEVGYDSEPAFSRAFKRLMGVSPAAWRRARVGGVA